MSPLQTPLLNVRSLTLKTRLPTQQSSLNTTTQEPLKYLRRGPPSSAHPSAKQLATHCNQHSGTRNIGRATVQIPLSPPIELPMSRIIGETDSFLRLRDTELSLILVGLTRRVDILLAKRGLSDVRVMQRGPKQESLIHTDGRLLAFHITQDMIVLKEDERIQLVARIPTWKTDEEMRPAKILHFLLELVLKLERSFFCPVAIRWMVQLPTRESDNQGWWEELSSMSTRSTVPCIQDPLCVFGLGHLGPLLIRLLLRPPERPTSWNLFPLFLQLCLCPATWPATPSLGSWSPAIRFFSCLGLLPATWPSSR